MTIERGREGPNDKDRNPEQNITSVSVTESLSGVRFADWKGVTAGLQAFVTGEYRGAYKNFNPYRDNISSVSFVPGVNNPEDYPIDNLLKELRRGVNWKGLGHAYYDRSDENFPWRSSVYVSHLPKHEGLLLEIRDGLGGPVSYSTAEKGIADLYGVERGIESEKVRVTYEPDEDRFRYNFDAITDSLAPVIGIGEHPMKERVESVLHRAPGERAAKHFMKTRSYPKLRKQPMRDLRHFRMGIVDDFAVDLSLGSVGDRYDQFVPDEGYRDRWNRNGAVISGPVYTYYDGSKTKPPVLDIGIHRTYVRDGFTEGHTPVIEAEDKSRIRQLASDIQTVFTAK